MLYLLFATLAILYNIFKFWKERDAFFSSFLETNSSNNQEMILKHHFYIFIFETFFSVAVAHLVADDSMVIGIVGFGCIYIALAFIGFYLYKFFIRYVERRTGLEIYTSFKKNLVREMRVNFAIILLPILIYSIISWAFEENFYEEWGNLWFIGLILNIIFVSVLTIVCSVILMLRLIPNREITEPEYLEVINKRLAQINQPHMRVRWIETDIKNAFVVGIKLLKFSNQTMFVGKSLRNTLTLEEFDAIIAHEVAHVANRHIHRRVIDLLKNMITITLGTAFILLFVFTCSILYWGEDAVIHSMTTTLLSVGLAMLWAMFNYALLFESIRAQELEADGYAVIELGASFSAFKSGLEKLTHTEELPEFLKKRVKKSKKGFFSRVFSTHPQVEDRIKSLEMKIASGLPFNYYVSKVQRVRTWLARMTDWKVSVPVSLMFVMTITWGIWNYQDGKKTIAFINKATSDEIMQSEKVASMINSKPLVVGPTLMYYIVRKKDDALIDHFIKNGAVKGKTVYYISQQKDFSRLQKYYTQFQNDLTEDEYFLVLRETADMNFTEGYRLLVNSSRFETLSPDYKNDVARVHSSAKMRAPASEQK